MRVLETQRLASCVTAEGRASPPRPPPGGGERGGGKGRPGHRSSSSGRGSSLPARCRVWAVPLCSQGVGRSPGGDPEGGIDTNLPRLPSAENVALFARPSGLDGTARTVGSFLAQRVVRVVAREPGAVLRGGLTHGALAFPNRGDVLFLRLPALVARVSVVAHLLAGTRKTSSLTPDLVAFVGAADHLETSGLGPRALDPPATALEVGCQPADRGGVCAARRECRARHRWSLVAPDVLKRP